jgi:hypothetical protein
VRIAHEYGARAVEAVAGAGADYYLRTASLVLSAGSRIADPTWILCLDPRESLSESLAASLYEWKTEAKLARAYAAAFSVFLREETGQGWVQNPVAQTRLVPSDWNRWQGWLPVTEPSAVALEGELLSFVFP